ncbi:calcium-activated chloride channel regulator 2 [Ixodes scapularis]
MLTRMLYHLTCGFVVRFQEERVNEELSLVAYAGSVQVKSNLAREDLSPAPIRDLVVSEAKLDDEGMTATLSWTSMGAYLDSGRARAVDIRAGSHPRVLLFTFNNATPISQADVLEGSLEPLEPYRPQKVKVKLPGELVSRAQGRPNSIYLGMRTLNDKGRASSVSNIVPVTKITPSKPAPPTVRHPDVTRKPEPRPPEGETTVPPPGQNTSDKTPYTVSMPEKKTSYVLLLLGLLGALLMTTVLAICVYKLVGRDTEELEPSSKEDSE